MDHQEVQPQIPRKWMQALTVGDHWELRVGDQEKILECVLALTVVLEHVQLTVDFHIFHILQIIVCICFYM
jgi:hypothetical protein